MKPLQILIVEDNRLQAREVRSVLEELEYEIAGVFHTGEEAVQFARQQPPDLVIMDIQLEGNMDGIDAAAKIRENPSIQIIYLTDQHDSVYRKRAMPTDPSNYLTKPFNETDLQMAVELAFQKMEQRQLESAEVDWVFIHDERALKRLDLDEILWIEASGSYNHVITARGKHTVSGVGGLDGWMKKLPQPRFLRISRSVIVHSHKIEGLDGNQLAIRGAEKAKSELFNEAGNRLIITASYKEALVKILPTI